MTRAKPEDNHPDFNHETPATTEAHNGQIEAVVSMCF